MQSIFRSNSTQGINPENNCNAENNNVETSFVRMSSLHGQFYQHYLSTNQGYQKLTKHFFVNSDICYGCKAAGQSIQPGLQTVIMLNCKCNGNNLADYNNSKPQIHIETIDDTCRQFINTERNAGRSVTELTLKFLCEQLKYINISDTEKNELIFAFIQRRGTPDEEVISTMQICGFDFQQFTEKKGISTERVLLTLMKSDIDPSEYAQQKQISDDEVIIAMLKHGKNTSDFAMKKGISNIHILYLMMISGFDISTFSNQNNISETQCIEVIIQSKLPIENKIQTIKQYFQLDLQEEQEKINSVLLKNEFELINERAIQFMNNRCREITLELTFKQMVLNQQLNSGLAYVSEISRLKQKIQELEKQLIDQQSQHTRDLSLKLEFYGAELSKTKNYIESMKTQYMKDLKQQQDKYKSQIILLQQSIQDDSQISQQLIDYQKKQYIYEPHNDQFETIENQLQDHSLKQQLINEKRDHDEQYTLMLEQLQRKNQRYNEIYKQLAEERTQRLQYFQQLSEKQIEITKQLESRGNEQTSIISQLQTDNQNLQDDLSALKQQIEIINICQYQQRIEKQDRLLQDKDKKIETLTVELQQANVKLLQNRQIDEVLEILKTMTHKE
ncbi:Dbl_homology (DH) domain [Hexamita inflata]|uniref:Dbl homology (DH) domain n=1 Tax=Hexamita inflata TaxID=28002 RepID=A0AA86RIL5_9EUKA|nr:Dbl homology (DH) domain [Hexamita inflata]